MVTCHLQMEILILRKNWHKSIYFKGNLKAEAGFY